MASKPYNLSLTGKAILLSIFAGIGLWLALDYYQSIELQQTLKRELIERLSSDSESANSAFYHAVEQHGQVVRGFAKTEQVTHWLLNKAETPNAADKSWTPSIRQWQNLIHPSAFLLYDKNKQLISTKQIIHGVIPPKPLSTESAYWIEQSFDRTLISLIDEKPSLIATAPIYYNDQILLGYFTIYIHLDEHFLYQVLSKHLDDQTTAVLMTGGFDQQTVWASSNTDKFPIGTTSETILKTHVFSGKRFLDQGDWGLQAQLAILLPLTAVDNLSSHITSLNRQQRLISTSVFIFILIVVVIALSQRIHKIATEVRDFGAVELGIAVDKSQNNDAISNLHQYFLALADEVKRSRHALHQQHELDKQQSQIDILQSVTDNLKIGVLHNQNNKLTAINRPMREFARQVGDINLFNSKGDTLDTVDRSGTRRIFKISRQYSQQRALILVSDTTELAEKNEQLVQLALHDPLTSLPNRTLFNDRLSNTLALAERSNEPFSIMVMDLNRFKDINDTLGHATGDLILIDVAYRLNQYFRNSDTFARVGGDEFSLLLPGANELRAQFIAAKLLEAQRQPHQVGEHILDVGLSIGIVSYPKDGKDASTLISRADMAMYHAKRNQLGQASYSSSIDSSKHDQLVLAAELRAALQKGQLEVYYQPQVDMLHLKIVSWEALVRWNHPTNGMISPALFIPLAEQTGLVHEITNFVITEAIKNCKEWQQEGQRGRVSINLSTYDLSHHNLADSIYVQAKKHGIRNDQVMLEVTESALMKDPKRALKILEQLDEYGFHISVDDFGTGYSSLAYLKELPVDEIKIDQIFVRNMAQDSDDQAIVQAVIGLARSLGMKTVAEGIEDKMTFTHLQTLGCDIGQGYYMGKPMPLSELKSFRIDKKIITDVIHDKSLNVIDVRQIHV